MIGKPWSFIRSHLPLIALLAVIVVIAFFPPGWDWINWFRPATLAMLSGESPYNLKGFFNPPWLLIPFIPLAFLPERVGVVVISIAYITSYIFVSRKLGAKALTIAVLLTSPSFFYGLTFANIDWIVALGFLMPPQIGLFFVLVKPQIGLGISIYWLFESWRNGGVKQVVKVFFPVTIAFIFSFFLYGLWPLRSQQWASNSSLWPVSIPIGLVLLTTAIRNRRRGLSIVASPFLAPYVGVQSWAIATLGLLPHQLETIVAVLGLWVVHIVENEQLRMWLFGSFL